MSKIERYETEKRRIMLESKSTEEYEARIKALIKRLKI